MNLPIMQLLVLRPGAGQDSKYVVEEEVDVGNSKFCIYQHAAEHSVYPDLGWPISYAVNYFVSFKEASGTPLCLDLQEMQASQARTAPCCSGSGTRSSAASGST